MATERSREKAHVIRYWLEGALEGDGTREESLDDMEREIAEALDAARAEEREVIAKEFENSGVGYITCMQVAKMIRARAEEDK